MASVSHSGFGSDQSDARAALAELRRAEVLSHTRYPETSRWHPAWIGVLVGIWIGSFAAPARVGLPIRFIVFVVFFTGVIRYIHRRGVMPRLATAPGPIRNALLLYLVAVAIMVASLGLLWQWLPWWAVSAAGSMVAFVGTRWYLRLFADAARRAEAEVGSMPYSSTS